ncbi:winged helix-turn-helix domain-containing protein [Pseudomonas sp. JQ170]|uniref:winged helix-turn-helix domain-containing protein n=1 Tax=unclassified Pseudomonas TaxID=196821 RepID=UPI00264EECF6|nr:MULTISPECIES: winged helix-turn-helix domain-containing protein [unclassified Pseudomonas]MDN7140672.1 winged helix-turn-helix domain-containing protein [Pseudomonas sp. JQ170]WRO75962.1 winged helix-turn-helix domain-containing protein [Pseudomonas sp. 170C]
MIYHFRLKSRALVEFDPELCKLLVHKIPGAPETLSLARADARILELLLSDPGAVCSREAILEFAWEDRVVSAGSLNQSIFALRNMLEDGKDHDIVITVPRRGYRFNTQYLVHSPDTPAPQSPAAPPGKSQGIGPAIWLGYLAVAVFALFTLWRVYAWYQPTGDLYVANAQQGELAISAVGKNEADVNDLQAELSEFNLAEQNLRGHVYVSRTGPRMNLSCLRENGDAYNLEFQFQHEHFISMLKKCVAGS